MLFAIANYVFLYYYIYSKKNRKVPTDVVLSATLDAFKGNSYKYIIAIA